MLIVFNLNNYDPRGSPILPSLHRTLSITTRGSRGVSTISVIDDQQPTERGGESDRDILISRSHSIFKTARPYPPPLLSASCRVIKSCFHRNRHLPSTFVSPCENTENRVRSRHCTVVLAN